MPPTTGRTGRLARAGGVLLAVGAAAVLAAPARFVPDAADGPTRGGGAGPDAAGPGPDAVAADGLADALTIPAPATGPAAVGSAPTADLRLVELRGGWRDAEDLATAVALAALVGAAHVDGGGDHARVAVEAVEQPGPDAAVVTLLVAPGDTADPDAPRAVRLAVPVRTGAGGVRVGGTPWRLPGPRLDPDPPPGRPVTDPALLESAAAALGGAGFDASALASLAATDGWPFVARLDGAAGGAGTAAPPLEVWLRWHLDRFVVTGLPLRPAAGSGQGTEVP